jgi:hypothetical protein
LPCAPRARQNRGFVDQWELSSVQVRCPPSAWSDADPYPLPPFVPQDFQATPDIHPGKYNPLPVWEGRRMLACQWQEWALNPPANALEAMDVMFELGRKDGRAWADQNGFPA